MTDQRLLRSYGRRKARVLSPRKEALLAELLPQLRLDLSSPPPSPLSALFPVPVAEVWLEIGFGAGEHLLHQAAVHADIGFIGCEPFINGIASLLGEIEARGLQTVRIHDGDARDALSWLPAASIARTFVLFPDPWPKARHQKRRLLSAETLAALARVLAGGGELRFASDDADYVEQVAQLAGNNADFVTARSPHPDVRPTDWPQTRYEQKALKAGRQPAYFSYRRTLG